MNTFGKLLSFVLLSLLMSCSSEKSENKELAKKDPISSDTKSDDDSTLEKKPIEIVPPTVMIIPCSNGYNYNLKMGDLNPSLEKYLKKDKRIQVVPFPLKDMQGTGYFGVFDKVHCKEILKRTDVDILIMTQMKGLEFSTKESNAPNWGYATKFLDTKTMEQYEGISVDGLSAFEEIDEDLKYKADDMVNIILNYTAPH